MAERLAAAKRTEAQLVGLHDDTDLLLALAEGIALGAYAFGKYKTGKAPVALKRIRIVHPDIDRRTVDRLNDLVGVVGAVRDLVNEPASALNAVQLASELRTLCRNAGVKYQMLDKAQIEAMGMGGLLAVNKGSVDPPTFSILEHKPRKAVNAKPIVLVGKGVVYDTGGLSLKPTPNSMDHMKCDMAGGACVAGAIAAAALLELPVHVVALVPATDNRPGGNAFAPGDVVRMHNGLTVEVMNSDAEGRMLLADALSYAEPYGAETIITVATLTGAAARAIGTQGIVAMGTADDAVFDRLKAAGDQVHERIAHFPFWKEYDRELDSDIADLKNLGGDSAGMITAGKFLARFTTRPYIHLDIAGPAFLTRRDGYRPKGGTGTGVRLLVEFLQRRAKA
ncbi:MAG: peptidase M17 [Flavobacteriales bacterium]|nr:peptidase M17 [Flavobacteriales bacterium]NUQ15681.1 peptidase M17 [Flavobacteriales bacterium]